jgi:transposase-like protein
LRDIEELLFERGVIVTYETIRCWCDNFGKRRFQKDVKGAVNFMDKLLTLAVVTTRSRR